MSEQQGEQIVGWKAKTRNPFDTVKEEELSERCMEGLVCKSKKK